MQIAYLNPGYTEVATAMGPKNLSVADQSQRSQQSCKGVAAKSQCGHRSISVADCLLGIPKRRIVTGSGAQRLVISR